MHVKIKELIHGCIAHFLRAGHEEVVRILQIYEGFFIFVKKRLRLPEQVYVQFDHKFCFEGFLDDKPFGLIASEKEGNLPHIDR